jgi:hypothetical protein
MSFTTAVTHCNGICKDGSLCKNKSKITDTNGKHFCVVHIRQGVLLETDCSICMDALCNQALTLTKCKHVFHTKCLKNWTINFNTNCPLCRAKIIGTQQQVDVTTQIRSNLQVMSQIRLDLRREVDTRMLEISDIRSTLSDIRRQIFLNENER